MYFQKQTSGILGIKELIGAAENSFQQPDDPQSY